MSIIRTWLPVFALFVSCAAFAQQEDLAAKQKAAFRWVNPLPGDTHPRVQHKTFHSRIQNTEVGYAVYLPEQYDPPGQASQRYPVVYYLHGGRPGGENKSVRLATQMDSHIRSGAVPPMIYVFVNGGMVSHYDYPQEQSFGERVFLEELIPHIDSTYRTIAAKKGRGLEGFSQGGRGTARIALKRPDLFCSAAPMGGGHQHEKYVSENQGKEDGPEGYEFEPSNNTWDIAAAYSKRKGDKVDLLVVVGTKDFNYEANLEWMAHLTKLGIPYEKIIVPEVPHNAGLVYEKVGLRAMQFHSACFAR